MVENQTKQDADEFAWEKNNEIVKTVKSSGDYAWMHIILALNKKEGKQYIRLRKWKQNFNIKSREQLIDLLKALFSLSEEINWDVELSEEETLALEDERTKLEKLTKKYAEENQVIKEKMNKAMVKLSKYRALHLQNNLPRFKKDIKDFEKILSGKQSEKDIQNWLKERPWFFGPTYLEQDAEVIASEKNKLDFVLQRYDTFYDFIELKLPEHSLFVKTAAEQGKQQKGDFQFFELSRNFRISGEVKDAISQLIGYLETYSRRKSILYEETNKMYHKPKGMLILGRTNKDEIKALRTLNSYLNSIEIMTYDNLLTYAKNFVKLISNKQTKKSINKRLNND